MALEYLCFANIKDEKEIAVHPEATHYFIKRKKILFYRANPSPSEKMKLIPRKSNTIEFPDYIKHKHWIYYGKPKFTGHQFYKKEQNTS